MDNSVKLYRAVILQLFIDGISTNTARQENIMAKLDARLLIFREKEDFIKLCNLAEISHEQTKRKFLEIIKLSKRNKIVFLDYEKISLYPCLPIERK